MDEENIIQEIKNSQKKFTDYLIKNPVQIKKLIEYVIKEPNISLSNDTKQIQKNYKYPFIASEIFNTQS